MTYFTPAMSQQIMWVSNIKTFEIIEATPALKEIFKVEIDRSYVGDRTHYLANNMWFSEALTDSIKIHRRVNATGETHSNKMYMLDIPEQTIRKYICTRSKIEEDINLAVLQDITAGSQTIPWLEALDIPKRVVKLPNGNKLTFKNLEALHLMVHGYSYKAIAKILSITLPTVKARLASCARQFKCTSNEALRIECTRQGLTHVLLTGITPPYPYGDEYNMEWLLTRLANNET